MVINNAGDVFKLCISTKRKHMLYSLIDMRVIFHINILNDSEKLLMQVYEETEESYNACI